MRVPPLIAAALVAAALPASAWAATTIADAPTFEYDTLTSGGGPPTEFWRIRAFSGDKVTFRWDQTPSPRVNNTQHIQIFDPAVDDYRVRDATPLFEKELAEGKSEFAYTVPFTGLGTLKYYCMDIGGCNQSPAYSFVASVEHRTAVVWRRLPRRVASARARVSVSAEVQSPAGSPAGYCAIDRIAGAPRRLATVPVRGGTCIAHVRTGTRRAVRFRARFLPDRGWLASAATSPPVRTLAR